MNLFKLITLVTIGVLTLNGLNAQTGTFTDPRDSQVYSTVKIGDQLWLAENLRIETENSIALKVKKNKYQTNLDDGFKWAKECGTTDEYGVKAILCGHLAKVGRYYPWEDANIACPDGWHLASSEDWETLFNYITEKDGPFKNKTPFSNSKDYFVGVAKLLKSAYWPDETDLTDPYGFGILPDGRAKYDKISIIGQVAEFWTSTPLIYKSGEQSKGYYKYIKINQFGDNVFREDGIDSYGRSVRRVKD
jgi:uncharacterized protein (TIGR02145 family)